MLKIPFFFVFFFLPIIQLTNISNILIKSTANTLLNKDINIFSFQYLNINSFLKWIDYVDSIKILLIFVNCIIGKKKNTKKNDTNKLFSYKFVSLFIINVLINLI